MISDHTGAAIDAPDSRRTAAHDHDRGTDAVGSVYAAMRQREAQLLSDWRRVVDALARNQTPDDLASVVVARGATEAELRRAVSEHRVLLVLRHRGTVGVEQLRARHDGLQIEMRAAHDEYERLRDLATAAELAWQRLRGRANSLLEASTVQHREWAQKRRQIGEQQPDVAEWLDSLPPITDDGSEVNQ